MFNTVMKGITLILLTIVIYLFLDVTFMSSNIFNMITVNTVLIGFLFTILTILMSFIDEDVILTYEKTDELKKVYNNITIGIVLGVISIAISITVLCVWGEPSEIDITELNKLINSSIVGMFIIIMKSILVAILDMNSIITDIRRRKISNWQKENANREMKNIYKKD